MNCIGPLHHDILRVRVRACCCFIFHFLFFRIHFIFSFITIWLVHHFISPSRPSRPAPLETTPSLSSDVGLAWNPKFEPHNTAVSIIRMVIHHIPPKPRNPAHTHPSGLRAVPLTFPTHPHTHTHPHHITRTHPPSTTITRPPTLTGNGNEFILNSRRMPLCWIPAEMFWIQEEFRLNSSGIEKYLDFDFSKIEFVWNGKLQNFVSELNSHTVHNSATNGSRLI